MKKIILELTYSGLHTKDLLLEQSDISGKYYPLPVVGDIIDIDNDEIKDIGKVSERHFKYSKQGVLKEIIIFVDPLN